MTYRCRSTLTLKVSFCIRRRKFGNKKTGVPKAKGQNFAVYNMPYVFKLKAFLRQVHRMTWKWPWIFSSLPNIHKVKGTPYMLPETPSTKFISQPISLYRQPAFSRHRPCWGIYIWLEIDLSKIKVRHICNTIALSPKVTSVRSATNFFFTYSALVV